jgi:hypothetical protein
MERTPSPNVIPFPTFDHGLDAEPNVISIFNAKPLPCDFADNRVDPYAGLEEQERRAAIEADTRRDIRVKRWQSRVKWGCIVLAYAAIIFFAWQIGRGAL